MNTIIANIKSDKGFKQADGTTRTFTVNIYGPTPQEWVEHFGGKLPEVNAETQAALERWNGDYNQHKVANNLASRQKADYALHYGLSDVKDPSEASKKRAAETVRKLEAGEVFDLRDVVAKTSRAAEDKREVLVGLEKLVEVVTARWVTNPEDKRAAFVAKYKLDVQANADAGSVVAALNAKYKAPSMAVEDGDLA